MTTVRVTRYNKSITSVHCSGHTGYDVQGYDIVCAALSSIVQTTLLGLMQVLSIKVEYNRVDGEGVLFFDLPEMDSHTRREADILLDTMLLGILDLHESYSDFVELIIV